MEKFDFKYHPHFDQSDLHIHQLATCQVCGTEVRHYIDHMYTDADVTAICLTCVSSGRAAEALNGTFIDFAEAELVSDEKKISELFHRTPGYSSWQGEHWLACCEDFCAFLGDTDLVDLESRGIKEKVIADYEARGIFEDIHDKLQPVGMYSTYLFRCLHCQDYKIWIDLE